MYFMLTGSYPFVHADSSKSEVFCTISTGTMSVGEGRPAVGEIAKDCISQLLQRRPEDRLGAGGIEQVCSLNV